MGELLVESTKQSADSFSITWENFTNKPDGGFELFLPFTKIRGNKGEVVDIFSIQNSKYCPAAALNKLLDLQIDRELYQPFKPVFIHCDGTLLSKCQMNKLLEDLLKDFGNWNLQKITCKSFRSGIPSLIDISNHKANDVKLWGRWSSSSFERYTKYRREKKMLLFKNLCELDSMKILLNK